MQATDVELTQQEIDCDRQPRMPRMSEMIERVAEAMYWGRVNPNKGDVTLSVAVQSWRDLADEHRSGIQVWHCKDFWREAAQLAIEAMREPTTEMQKAWIGPYPWDQDALDVYQAMIDAALQRF